MACKQKIIDHRLMRTNNIELLVRLMGLIDRGVTNITLLL